MVSCGCKNGDQTNMCLKEVELLAQNVLTILGLNLVNISREGRQGNKPQHVG